ncbi:hypothetical protein EC988_001870 [Linderina pennispora]|nr:hypothetical protein EC988_001870 [Linderina pennispora]
MKLPIAFTSTLLASAYAHYSCTVDQALDRLINSNTTDIMAAQFLKSLETGAAKWQMDVANVPAEAVAADIISRYRLLRTTLPWFLASQLPPI